MKGSSRIPIEQWKATVRVTNNSEDQKFYEKKKQRTALHSSDLLIENHYANTDPSPTNLRPQTK
jgi:hypothetical protein